MICLCLCCFLNACSKKSSSESDSTNTQTAEALPPPKELISSSPELTSIPQSHSVTLDVKDMPLAQVCKEISIQIGMTVECGFQIENAPVTISKQNAPLLSVLGEICLKGKWGIESIEGMNEGVKVTISDNMPIYAFQTQGPLLQDRRQGQHRLGRGRNQHLRVRQF